MHVPNDGQHEAEIPQVQSLQARIKVAAAENVFFNVNTADLEIETTDFVLSTEAATISGCNNETETLKSTIKPLIIMRGHRIFTENLPLALAPT